jgi:putative transposase
MEFPDLKKRYWDLHFWAIVFDCWRTGNITDEMVNEYLGNHKNPNENNNENFIIEDCKPCRLLVCQPNLWTSIQ